MRIWGGFVGLAVASAVAACGGVTTDSDPSDGSGGSDGNDPGELPDPPAACENGQTREADDGCNTCACQDGTWVCTTAACLPPACQEGASMPAPDHCNTCTCTLGRWACTLVDCPTECTPGEWSESADCEGDCVCSDAGVWECAEDCPDECWPGTVKSAGDGCNTCECPSEGIWACTDTACPEPTCPVPDGEPEAPCPGDSLYARAEGTDACCELCGSYEGYHHYDSLEACEASKVCTPDATKYADDECNICLCSGDGTWACTDTDCEPVRCGGFSVGTCTEDEYCAYTADFGGCGAGDQSAVCRPRPTKCTEEEAPVCSCGGETFSNACLANLAGFGVGYDGECQ